VETGACFRFQPLSGTAGAAGARPPRRPIGCSWPTSTSRPGGPGQVVAAEAAHAGHSTHQEIVT
jgi:hypothetical protein